MKDAKKYRGRRALGEGWSKEQRSAFARQRGRSLRSYLEEAGSGRNNTRKYRRYKSYPFDGVGSQGLCGVVGWCSFGIVHRPSFTRRTGQPAEQHTFSHKLEKYLLLARTASRPFLLFLLLFLIHRSRIGVSVDEGRVFNDPQLTGYVFCSKSDHKVPAAGRRNRPMSRVDGLYTNDPFTMTMPRTTKFHPNFPCWHPFPILHLVKVHQRIQYVYICIKVWYHITTWSQWSVIFLFRFVPKCPKFSRIFFVIIFWEEIDESPGESIPLWFWNMLSPNSFFSLS